MKRTPPERRNSRRRSLPFVRSAVLEIAKRSHIVAIADLGPDGAFLRTSTATTIGQEVKLRLVLPRDGREVVLAGRVVWRSERFDAETGRPAGVAVRFQGLDARTGARIEEFAMAGFLPTIEPVPADHFEYRILERQELDADELNRLGLDGWELTSVVPAASGLRLVLLRRL